MPLWVPLVAIGLATVLFMLGSQFGWAENLLIATGSLMFMAGAVLAGFFHLTGRPGWMQWLALAGPVGVAAVTVALSWRPVPPPAPPVGRCARCGAPLFADHTGRRFYSTGAQYLCEEAYRTPGQRRHQLADAATLGVGI